MLTYLVQQGQGAGHLMGEVRCIEVVEVQGLLTD